MGLTFTKMHGLGNDFMVIDGVRQIVEVSPEMVRALANRHTGVGFDQLLLVETCDSADADFVYRIFNASGEEVAQCGNGARCLARFIQVQGLSKQTQLRLKTQHAVLHATLLPNAQVSVDLGPPHWHSAAINLPCSAQQPLTTLATSIGELSGVALDVGNPHFVTFVDNLQNTPVTEIAQEIASMTCFPQGCNVNFAQVLNPTHLRLRVVERGAGETLACGSGAAAGMVAAHLTQGLATTTTVSLPGGDLEISWPGETAGITVTGPAEFVYEGKL